MRLSWRRRLRDLPGVMLVDVPRYRRALDPRRGGVSGWTLLANRRESLLPPSGGRGVRCDWTEGSRLHAPAVLPSLGRWLMRRALAEWPVALSSVDAARGAVVAHDERPDISVIFAHAGRSRLPQLLRTLRSLRAMSNCRIEVIVVDQGEEQVGDALPPDVQYRHLDKQHIPPGWYKSWAYNVGARLAKAPLLVFHDGDICVPRSYGSELKRVFKEGYEAASLQRFLFYLAEDDVPGDLACDAWVPMGMPTSVYQNWKGGTIAILRDAFFDLGGFDEGFVDWGGEDDEFHDRCGTLRHCRDGYLPFVHLWHAPQAGRTMAGNPNTSQVLPSRLAMPRHERIAEMNARAWGNPAMPDPGVRYA